jgi:hypothetical protein
MTRKSRLVAAFVFGAGLTAAGMAVAQTHTGNTAPAAASASRDTSAQPAPPPAQSAPATQALDPNAYRPTYSPDPPPDSTPGIYLPSVILGYARSATACVVVGCEDGPRVRGEEPSSGAGEPLPVTPGPFTPH